MSSEKKISVVVSVYNEEESLEEFYKVTKGVLSSCSWDHELIFVNDGSGDKSEEILSRFARNDKKVRVVNFARNFGHEAAMIAGIDYSNGDGIICMDADLQHPAECIPEIIAKFEEGYEVVSMIRTKNHDTTLFKKIASSAFYKILNTVSSVKFEESASDFFAFTKNVATVLKKDYREKVRYLRGYVQSVGFKKTTLEFEAAKRFAGKSKYSIKKLIKFSVNALCSFSVTPLKAGSLAGVITLLAFLVFGVGAIVMGVTKAKGAGIMALACLLCLLFAVLFFVLGVIGEYLAVILTEIKDRPVYIVKDVLNEE